MREVAELFDQTARRHRIDEQALEQVVERGRRIRARRRVGSVGGVFAVLVVLVGSLAALRATAPPTATSDVAATGSAPALSRLPGGNVEMVGGEEMPFDAPTRYVVHGPDRTSVSGAARTTFDLVVPSAVVAGGIDASIAVSMRTGGVDAAAPGSVTEVASRETNRRGFVQRDIGGREVAVLADAEVVSGSEFGQPDRHGAIYLFVSGEVVVEVVTYNADDAEVVALIESFDDQVAASITR